MDDVDCWPGTAPLFGGVPEEDPTVASSEAPEKSDSTSPTRSPDSKWLVDAIEWLRFHATANSPVRRGTLSSS